MITDLSTVLRNSRSSRSRMWHFFRIIDLEFQTNHDVKILITDLTGKIISQKIRPDFIKGELIIDLANIQNGMYNCSIITDLEVHNQSVLILR